MDLKQKIIISTEEQMKHYGIELVEPQYNIDSGFSELCKSKGWYNGNAKVYAMKANYVSANEGVTFNHLMFSSE